MKPPKIEYEKIDTNDFTTGTIEKIQYEEKHEFKFQDKLTVAPAVRFKFNLDGYEHSHYSRWMRFNYGVKSNLYGKYLVPLVENAMPEMDFEIEHLEGLRVKILWVERNGFFNVDTIRPAGGKVRYSSDIQQPEESIIDDDILA